MLVWSLGWEDPPEEEMASHSSILTWKIPWTGKPGGLQCIRLLRVRHSWAHTSFTGFFFALDIALAYSFSLLVASTLSYSLGTTEQLTQICAHPCLKTDPSDGMYLGLLESSLSDTPPGEIRLCGAGSLLELFFCFLCGAPLPEEVFAVALVTGQWAQKVSGMRMGPSLASPALRGGEGGRRRAREVSPPPHLAPTCGWQPFFLSPCPAQEGGWNN